MTGETERPYERYERAAEAIAQNLTDLIRSWPDGYYFHFQRRCEATRTAEEQDRREWIADVKRRLGLVGIGEIPFIIDWSPDPRCRCSFVLNGERVSLGRPCPVHEAAA